MSPRTHRRQVGWLIIIDKYTKIAHFYIFLCCVNNITSIKGSVLTPLYRHTYRHINKGFNVYIIHNYNKCVILRFSSCE